PPVGTEVIDALVGVELELDGALAFPQPGAPRRRNQEVVVLVPRRLVLAEDDGVPVGGPAGVGDGKPVAVTGGPAVVLGGTAPASFRQRDVGGGGLAGARGGTPIAAVAAHRDRRQLAGVIHLEAPERIQQQAVG